MIRRLTIAQTKDLSLEELVDMTDQMTSVYDPPDDFEPLATKVQRLGRTLDELPTIYRWFLTLESWLDEMVDTATKQFGASDATTKAMRRKRDAMNRAASAAKMRYEGASRVITVLTSFDESGMPRGR